MRIPISLCPSDDGSTLNLLDVLLYSGLTAITTGLGAAPFLCMNHAGFMVSRGSNALAAGMMLAATLGLAIEALEYGWVSSALGAIMGILFIRLTSDYCEKHEDLKFSGFSGWHPRSSLLFLIVMTVHSFSEGIGIGVSFSSAESFGVYISLVLAIHNIPEGLAVALVLVPKGEGVCRAALWAILTSIPQVIMAVPAFIFTNTFRSLLPLGLGFAASCMAHVSIFELLPEALDKVDKVPLRQRTRCCIWLVFGSAFLLMLYIQTLFHSVLDVDLDA